MAKLYPVLATIVALMIASTIPAYAEAMTKPSSGKSLDISVDPQVGQDGQANIKVSFYKIGTKNSQDHVDYNVIVKDSSGKELFDAARSVSPNQEFVHKAVEPSVTIPYKFPQSGSYTIVVSIYSIVFVPINPESAEFSINVTPEFPAGAIAAVGVVMAVAMAATRLKKF
jgi:hypothetical protein